MLNENNGPNVEVYHGSKLIKCPHCRALYEEPPRCCRDAMLNWIKDRMVWLTMHVTPEGPFVTIKLKS